MSDPIDVAHLGKLSEELGECSAVISRCLIQGIDEREPTTGRVNRDWLEDELADVLANIELNMLYWRLNARRMRKRIEKKKAHLRGWHELLRRLTGN